jgi:hypothetical protein
MWQRHRKHAEQQPLEGLPASFALSAIALAASYVAPVGMSPFVMP